MKKIVILLSVMLFMVACEKGNEEMKEAKVAVSYTHLTLPTT